MTGMTVSILATVGYGVPIDDSGEYDTNTGLTDDGLKQSVSNHRLCTNELCFDNFKQCLGIVDVNFRHASHS